MGNSLKRKRQAIAVWYLLVFQLTIGYGQSWRTGFAASKQQAVVTDTGPDTVLFNIDKSLAEQLLPFDSLYQIAVRHSPAVHFEDAMIEGKAASLQVTKVLILQGLSPFFTYSAGNQAFVNTGSVSSDFLQLANGRRMGINIQIPVSEVVGRRYRIQQMKAELRAASARRDISKLELKRDLNRSYQAMLTAHRLLAIRIRDAQIAMVAFRVAEVEMQQGKITPASLATSSNVYAISQHNVEKERGDLLSAMYDMVALIGVDLNRLIISR